MHTFWGTYYILTWAETLFVIFPKAFLGPQLADEWKCKSTFFRLVVNYQQFNPFVWAYKGLKKIMCKYSLSKPETTKQVLARKKTSKLISCINQQSIASKVSRKRILLKLAFFAIFSFIILLWLSPDSWLSHLCGPRFDPAWFFTAGRAWMEGLVPYVDFADSKGPVLWLIYGIGYLVSPTTYIGVFWQSVVYFTFSFYFVWLTARLFVNRREALLVIFLLPGMLFFRAYIIETRAEDFTFPWLFLNLYVTCRCLIKSPSIHACTTTFIRKGAFWMGFGMMFCLLIKWNIFFMMGGMALLVAGVSIIRKSLDGIVFGLLGMGVMALPFVIYFLLTGNFDAFIKEYFVNTYLITDTNTTTEMFSNFFSSLFASKLDILKNVVLVLPFLGIYAFCRRFYVSYWLIFAYVPFYFFLAFKAPFFHYCCTAVPFYIFLLLVLVHSISPLLSAVPRRAFISILAVIFIATMGLCGINTNLWFKPNKDKQEWYAIQKIMMRKEKPKFMFSGIDMGQGLLSRAVPACKYWALQSGANSDMIAERMNAIRARKPDFIVITQRSSTDFIPFIERCGYRQCYGVVIENGKVVTRALPLYAR